MSIRQILKSRMIVCTVPDARKQDAVYMALNAPPRRWRNNTASCNNCHSPS
ncbi:hypothetical protein SPIROBIBN47_260043 [uncultured spirochete]|uniref:Uncharacterized protein n=1 Tax=uncultured spirochete TaxID=156406 RepID=A0A3P3XII7_9SPIR|nr:hypothetical protein SPIROBIBN47_260043 [uncultured spirochete]